MIKLYSNAIHYLEEIYSNGTIENLGEKFHKSTDIFSNKKFSNNKRTYDTFNKLPLRLIEGFNNAQDIYTSLREFIDILKMLIKLDDEFQNLIKDYKNLIKNEKDYEIIETRLLNTLRFESTNLSENSKKVLQEAIKDLFSNQYQRSSSSNMYIYFYTKLFSYISTYYDNLLNCLAEYFVGGLCVKKSLHRTAKEFIEENRIAGRKIETFFDTGEELIFLSYAFHDRFFSFLLFLEAKSKKKVLFVDWMYSCEFEIDQIGTTELKRNLSYFLESSKKLIFLQSIHSELNTSPYFPNLFRKNQKMIRQWCSWEIGYFHKAKFSNEVKGDKIASRNFRYIMHSNVYDQLQNKKESDSNPILLDIEIIESISEI